MTEPAHLHEDDPARVYQDPITGRKVRNLNAEEYAASYSDPGTGPHTVDPQILDQAMAEAQQEHPDAPPSP